jgi:hypothetical protein
MALANRSADDWILDTGATNPVTSNRHLFETIQPMPQRKHQVTMTINNFFDSEDSGTSTLSIDRPNEKPVKNVPQHGLYVPSRSTINRLSIIQ